MSSAEREQLTAMPIRDAATIDRYYRALVARDPDFLGSFYVGVKTTSIFCIATCRARKPKQENVVFYTDLDEVLRDGFRPCKVCRPTENAHQAPPDVATAMRWVLAQPKQKVSDTQLRARGLSPEKIRRWFKAHYGMTYQQFQRMYRINTAVEELKLGQSVTASAMDSGYESLSGFGYTYKKLIGHSPASRVNGSPILLHRITTPIGPMFVAASSRGICLLEFVDRRMLETEFKDLQRLCKAPIIAGTNAHIHQAEQEIAQYFVGERTQFSVPLDTPGTEFQQKVWRGLIDIPYGSTASYQQQACRIAVPSAVRAVARANGHNRVAIIIPCHRVIGADGKLVGYGGGLERKRWLLEHENKFCS